MAIFFRKYSIDQNIFHIRYCTFQMRVIKNRKSINSENKFQQNFRLQKFIIDCIKL